MSDRTLPSIARYRLLLWSLLALVASATAHAQTPLEIDPARSEVGFAATQMGVTVKGGFSEWSADIQLDTETPANSSARVVVQTASIDTGHGDTDKEVKRKNWLAVEQFPTAVFESSTVERVDAQQWRAEGSLRIRDRSEPVTVEFTMEDVNGSRHIKGGFTIQRATFNVGGGAWGDFDVVANDVRIQFSLYGATP
ncbi:YceI family protein [Algiphilus sp.]|uniref:YceI family protein n=1 Tax=Algiphilus sp. TaxID=1872431 RepID=UPI0032EF3F24